MPVHPIPAGQHRTVVSLLREAALVNGAVEAYVEPGTAEGSSRRALTFGQLDRAADGVAAHLRERGVTKGDVVCLMLPSSIDYAVAYAALLRLGAITSGINPRLGPAEVMSIVERTAPVLAVTEEEPPPALAAATLATITVNALMAHATDEAPAAGWPELDEHDPVAVVWTSGTTGFPKGAVFDHANLAAVAAGTDVLSQPGDRRLSPLPFAHVGYMTRVWDEIAHGVTTVITPTPWRAEDAIRIISEEAITVAQGVPTQWALMLARPELGQADTSALRIVSSGAARMSAAQVAELRERLGVPVVVRYTSTESSLGTGTTLITTDEEVATTVGQPVPGVELAIVDDAGSPVEAGAIGRVLLRSGAAMRGYWSRGPGRGRSTGDLVDAAATAAVISPEGWVSTGDFGRLSAAGNLQLSGRAHERYIRGGYNVYPAEVDEVLSRHPSVERAAVIGTADPILGEIGVAVVVAATDAPAPDLATLRAHCQAHLSDYKAPDALVVVDELPLTPMMKVDPKALAVVAERAASERLAARAEARR